MAKLIEVEERDIDYIFGKSKPYYLDVYQRDYRWSDEKEFKIVTRFLKDIELWFENNLSLHKKNSSSDLLDILTDVEQNFKPYFLNTIMLNEQGGNIYIVDGQQRLTTILLILIKLYHIGMDHHKGKLNIQKFIGDKIYEEDKASRKQFKISNKDRNVIIKKIFEKDVISEYDITNITQKNLVDNYEIISRYYDNYFFDSSKNFDKVKYDYYFYFLTQNVLIIEQIIKRSEDVAMIFETANDRGKPLEPHEVLKGMLLGALDVEAKEACNTIWNNGLKEFYKADKNYKNVDSFFRTYFRAKYADNASQYDSFAGNYHRNLLSNEKIIQDLDRSKSEKIISFIENDFVFFYKLFLRVNRYAKNNENLFISSNYANEQGQQQLLILSALELSDPDYDEKLSLVAKKFDQFYTISRLINAGDNNDRQKLVYDLIPAIRNSPLNEIGPVFDRITIGYFKEHGFPIEQFNDLFRFRYFEKMKLDGRFTKYVLARVDLFLSEILHEPSESKQHSLHYITHSGQSPVNGFHVEHMFSNNELIMNQFLDEEGGFDEALFNEERNRLGALLLLKGNENIRTSNWPYKDKFDSYRNSGFLWNKILTGAINKASINSCEHEIKHQFKDYEPDEQGLLPRYAIDERQQLLFEIIKEIYSN
ncbi:MAG: DUF262 domain-containing protein [Bacteroidetes bacterium]|nr:DUF262 domain-containing protein [Bacteroidota bacterium]